MILDRWRWIVGTTSMLSLVYVSPALAHSLVGLDRWKPVLRSSGLAQSCSLTHNSRARDSSSRPLTLPSEPSHLRQRPLQPPKQLPFAFQSPSMNDGVRTEDTWNRNRTSLCHGAPLSGFKETNEQVSSRVYSSSFEALKCS
jgi:hypothetical protein